MTSLIGGHDFSKPSDREKIGKILEIPDSAIPPEPSWPYHRILEGVAAGTIRGLWIIGTNTSHSWGNQQTLNECLKKLDFLAVQDMYFSTETARRADLYLPAAGWGEKEG